MTAELFRGIKHISFIVDDLATVQAFPFDSEPNELGYIEESVNWNDDENALSEIRERRNSDNTKYEFAGGIGRIQIARMKLILQAYIKNKYFNYNHDPDPQNPDNQYHGNICILNGIETSLLKNIKHGLAVCIGDDIIPPLK